MTDSIVIVGGLPGDPDRNEVLKRLSDKSGNSVEWEWIRSEISTHDRPPQQYLNGLLTELQRRRKTGDTDDVLKVVKLVRLHGQVQSQIYRVCADPVLAPDVETVDEFIEWVFSPEANLIPTLDWFGNLEEAALIAILCKLLRNKSWNKDTQGHKWTKEEDLFGQAPVNRPDFPLVAIEARRMMGRLSSLLLEKGGTKGTPREWCIRLKHLAVIKQLIVRRSFNPLDAADELRPLARNLAADHERPYQLNGEIVNERVREICRQNH